LITDCFFAVTPFEGDFLTEAFMVLFPSRGLKQLQAMPLNFQGGWPSKHKGTKFP